MEKLPISETALIYYEETGYKFSYKEQAHLCYRYIPGLLERNKALREILEESDDEELNKDIRMMAEYEINAYRMFMDNKEGKCVYTLEIICRHSEHRYIFTTMEAAVAFVDRWVLDDYTIGKKRLFDGCDETDSDNLSTFTFKRGEPDEIIEYWSAEYDDVFNYDPREHGPFEERFDNIFMNVDCPFELGDIVKAPDKCYPVIVLCDRNIFHERYEEVRKHDWGNIIMTLDYEDNLIPVLDYRNDFSITYVRPFDLEKINPNKEDFSKSFCDDLSYISKMVRCKFNMDTIKTSIEVGQRYRHEFENE